MLYQLSYLAAIGEGTAWYGGQGPTLNFVEFFQSAARGSYCGAMRLSSAQVALAALIVTAGAVAGCGSSSNSSSSDTKTVDSSQISLAAFHSQKVPGFKFALDGKVSVAGPGRLDQRIGCV